MKDDRSHREDLALAYRRLADQGLMQLSSGNLSLRVGERMLITPTGADASVAPEAMVLTELDGRSVGEGIPSSEWALHAEVYRTRPEARAVVHAHGDACTALACCRSPLPAFHYMVASFGGDDVPCADYAPFGSRALAQNAAAALQRRNACLLANHGMICFAGDVAAAANRALKLEMLARQYLLSRQAGTPHLLGAAEMEEVERRYEFYGVARIPEAS